MKTIIATAVTTFSLFAVQSPASAGDYWHGGGHGASHVRHQWHGGQPYHVPQYSRSYAPRYSPFSSGFGHYGYGRGYHGYGGGYGRGAYSDAEEAADITDIPLCTLTSDRFTLDSVTSPITSYGVYQGHRFDMSTSFTGPLVEQPNLARSNR